MANKLETLCGKVVAARTAKDALKAKLDAASEELSELEEGLAQLIATEVGTGKGDKVSHDGMVFSAATKVAWKIDKDGRERLVGLLKEGAPELVKESVNAATLSSYLRKNEESLEDSSPSWWDSAKECLTRSESASLSVRKETKKKK